MSGSNRGRRYPAEVRERAVRMVCEHEHEYPSKWKAIQSIAEKLDIHHETLRIWVRRAETDAGDRPGVTTDERARMKALEKENKELRRANEILKDGGCRTIAPGVALVWGGLRSDEGFCIWLLALGWFGVQAMRQSLRRLWVAQMSFHSLSTAARPRWETVRIPRLCLICAKTGSIEAARFL